MEKPKKPAVDDSLLAKVTGLAGLVAYQSGSVVSRAIVKSPAGTVTLFAFDEGEGLSEHAAPFDALVHILDGEAEVTLSGTAHRLAEGDAIVMPAGSPHALKALTPFKMMLVMVRG